MELSTQTEKTKCLILSAGMSERMKSHKAFLRYSENENFLQHIAQVYRSAGIQQIITVINPLIERNIRMEDYKGIRFVRNSFPDLGRMYSLKKGLRLAEDCDFCFVQNIDNPFVSIDCISQLLESRISGDYAVPVYKRKGGHPILVSSKVIHHILNLQSDDFILNEILENFNRTNVEMNDNRVLVNINTPEDYERYFLNCAINSSKL